MYPFERLGSQTSKVWNMKVLSTFLGKNSYSNNKSNMNLELVLWPCEHVACTICSRFYFPVMFGKIVDGKRKLTNSSVSRDRKKILFHFLGEKNTEEKFPAHLSLIFTASQLHSDFMWAMSLRKWAKYGDLCATRALWVHLCIVQVHFDLFLAFVRFRRAGCTHVGPDHLVIWLNWNWGEYRCKPHS